MKHPLRLALAATFFVAGAFSAAPAVHAASLTGIQIQSVISLLQSFGADTNALASVAAALGGAPRPASGAAPSGYAACPDLSYNLGIGSTDAATGGEVSELQSFLGIAPTGYFGPLTQSAVESYQASHGIVSSGTPDTTGYGAVGPQTREALRCVGGGPILKSSVFVSLDPASPTQSVPVGASNVKWATFDMVASGEGVKVASLSAYADTSVHGSGLHNGKIVANGVQVGATQNIGEGAGNETNFALGSSLTLPAGQKTVIDVYADAETASSTQLSSGETAAVTLAAGNDNAQGMSSSAYLDVPAANVSGHPITVANALSVAPAANDPQSANIIAGTSNVIVGAFQFSAQAASYTVSTLTVLAPNAPSSGIMVALSYFDANRTMHTVSAFSYGTTTFSGLSMYVPAGGSAVLDVSVSVPPISSGSTSGEALNVSLDDGHGSTFSAVNNETGQVLTNFNGNFTNVAAGGTFYVRKTVPTFVVNGGQGGAKTPANPLYCFMVAADQAGAVDLAQFFLAVTSTGAETISNANLVDTMTGQTLLDVPVNEANGLITADLLKNTKQPQYVEIPAGAQKTFCLNGTVNGPTGGVTLTISLAADQNPAASMTAVGQAEGARTVWSDRSASGHSLTTADWINGYLLQDFADSAVSYSS